MNMFVFFFAPSLENGDLAKIKWKVLQKEPKWQTGITFSINLGRQRLKCTLIFEMKGDNYCKDFIELSCVSHPVTKSHSYL